MSWVEWQGEIWPTTRDAASLRVYIASPDVGFSRQYWGSELMHIARDETLAERDHDAEQWISVDVSDLHLQLEDWRHLANREIRADAAWHETHEAFNEFGNLNPAQVKMSKTQVPLTPDEPREPGGMEQWIAHDFILRTGARDGLWFPCELDAWMIRDKEYQRKEPESAEEVALFAAGPPNLRVITRMRFDGGSIQLPRVPGDPVAEARRRFREQLACEDFFEEKLDWNLRWTPDHAELVRMPGWRSSVMFWTRPWKKFEETGASASAD